MRVNPDPVLTAVATTRRQPPAKPRCARGDGSLKSLVAGIPVVGPSSAEEAERMMPTAPQSSAPRAVSGSLTPAGRLLSLPLGDDPIFDA